MVQSWICAQPHGFAEEVNWRSLSCAANRRVEDDKTEHRLEELTNWGVLWAHLTFITVQLDRHSSLLIKFVRIRTSQF
jgi:hypothetical protein